MVGWRSRQHTCFKKKNLYQYIYAIYAYSIYSSIEKIYSKFLFMKSSTSYYYFFSSGDWIWRIIATFLFYFFPHLGIFYWRFDTGGDICKLSAEGVGVTRAGSEPEQQQQQQHTFRDVLPSLLPPFFLPPPTVIYLVAYFSYYHVSPSSLREIYACSLLRSSSLLSFFHFSLSLSFFLSFCLSSFLFLSVHSCTHTQISSDALSADYSLFIKKKKKKRRNKLW